MKKLKVSSNSNSKCSSALFCDLDFSDCYTDFSFGMCYLHVAGPDETYHRVFCKASDSPGLMLKGGVLYWMVKGDE